MKNWQAEPATQPSPEIAVMNTPGTHASAAVAGVSAQISGSVFSGDPAGCERQSGHSSPPAPPMPVLAELLLEDDNELLLDEEDEDDDLVEVVATVLDVVSEPPV